MSITRNLKYRKAAPLLAAYHKLIISEQIAKAGMISKKSQAA